MKGPPQPFTAEAYGSLLLRPSQPIVRRFLLPVIKFIGFPGILIKSEKLLVSVTLSERIKRKLREECKKTGASEEELMLEALKLELKHI
ncbi:MAG: hypothetical protein QXE79_05995 [Candidatus Bathyarchaeia archaeon]